MISGDLGFNPGSSGLTGRTNKQMDLSNTCINSSIHVPDTVSVPRRRHRTLLSSFLLSKPTGSRHTCIIQKSYNSTSGITALSQQIQRRRNTGSLGTTTSHTCTTAGYTGSPGTTTSHTCTATATNRTSARQGFDFQWRHLTARRKHGESSIVCTVHSKICTENGVLVSISE